jgi:hypothetical protein
VISLSCRRWHRRDPVDDRAQGLRQPVVTFGQIGGDQLVQLRLIAKLLVNDLRVKTQTHAQVRGMKAME